MRQCGILLHISSLPSEYGIGNFGGSAYAFVDFLHDAGQSLWQILPLGMTGPGDSPYQSFSGFAGNPYFIDPELLREDGLLSREYLRRHKVSGGETSVDYGRLYGTRYELLRYAYESFDPKECGFIEFCEKNSAWLDPFALFMTLKERENGVAVSKWQDKYKYRDKRAIKAFLEKDENVRELGFWKFLQYKFFGQYFALKKYASEAGVSIIGDIPIYVAADSVDVWESPEFFKVTPELSCQLAAGCPPDSFNSEGQFWGNPIYDWERMKLDGYTWWRRRFEWIAELYDYVRIDHFRGFSSYYAIPGNSKSAADGEWLDGPGYDFFKTLSNTLSRVGIIAEDLGFIDDKAKALLSKCGYPGMKILEFGFDSDASNEHLPHNYGKKCVAYTGTHDNPTFEAYFEALNDAERRFVKDYLDCESNVSATAVKRLYASVADTVIIPLQDLLGLKAEGRMNTPSTESGNWKWRARAEDINTALAHNLSRMAALYGRALR